MRSEKKILIACEESQVVTKEFRKLGHNAFSCDILPCSGGHPEWHIQGDVIEQLNKGWDMMIGFPPCTYLTVTGARWLYNKDGSKNEERWENQRLGLEFFKTLYNAPIPRIALENPVGMISSLFIKPTQIIQPYYFGDEAQKTTCLWLKGLPLLQHFDKIDLFNDKITHVGKGEMVRTATRKTFSKWYWETSKGKGSERQKIRSKTFLGIAKALAIQYGAYIINNNLDKS